jgi:hypothetical protein
VRRLGLGDPLEAVLGAALAVKRHARQLSAVAVVAPVPLIALCTAAPGDAGVCGVSPCLLLLVGARARLQLHAARGAACVLAGSRPRAGKCVDFRGGFKPAGQTAGRIRAGRAAPLAPRAYRSRGCRSGRV